MVTRRGGTYSPPSTALLGLVLVWLSSSLSPSSLLSHAAEVEVAETTLTFESYYTDPHFRHITPVYVSEVDVVSYIPDKIVDFYDRTILSPEATGSINKVYYRRREGKAAWEQLPNDCSNLFNLTVQQDQVVLMIDLTAFKSKYAPLGGSGQCNYYNYGYPVGVKGADGIVPFPELNLHEQRKLVQKQRKRHRQERARAMKEEEMQAKEAHRILRSLQTDTASTNVSYESVRKTFKHKAMQVTSDYIYDFAILIDKDAGEGVKLERIDLTIVPRVSRQRPTATYCKPGSSNVSPGLRGGLPFAIYRPNAVEGLPGPEYYMCDKPRSERRFRRLLNYTGSESICDRSTGYSIKRDLGYTEARENITLSDNSFRGLHPEEAWWVDFRLDLTAAAIEEYILEYLPGRVFTDEEARIAVGVAHGGEGKRGALNSMGVASTLYDLGVYDHAAWVSASSGAAWHIASWYAASLQSNKLISPAEHYEMIRGPVCRAAVGDDFDGNDVMTDYFQGYKPFNTSKTAAARKARAETTDRIICDTELKLNAYNALEGVQGLPSFFEYMNRALAMEYLDPISTDALGVKVSDLCKATFLTRALGPLPIFQIHEGVDGTDGRLWAMTPYDTSVDKDDLHASFPTERLGYNTDEQVSYTTQFVDTLAFVAGISANLLPRLQKQSWADVICADAGRKNCGAMKLNNPLKMFDGIKDNGADPTMFEKQYIAVSGTGKGQSLPVWPFVSSTRKADVVFAIDASGGRGEGEYSSDRYVLEGGGAPRRGKKQCQIDVQGNGVSCPGAPAGVLYSSVECCNYCDGPEAAANGCWPTDQPDDHDLFYLPTYDTNNTLPPLPQTPEEIKPLLSRITFFGCDDVANTTAIVYIPNRLIKSGAAGSPAMKNILSYQIPLLNQTKLGSGTLEALYENGLAQVPAKDDPNSIFAMCLACLYYAKAKKDNSFLSQDDECQQCYQEYCYTASRGSV